MKPRKNIRIFPSIFHGKLTFQVFQEFVYLTLKPDLLSCSEGLSNLIFFVGLPPNIKVHDREPRQVLLRIFGNTLMPLEQETPESFITGIVMENVIFTILSERKLGPRLMGVFAGGRLEEYIPVIQKVIFMKILGF